MTATRTRRFWAIVASAGLWLAAAWLLWRTEVPELAEPRIEAAEVFTRRYLERSERYEHGLRLFWLGALAVQLVVLALFVFVGRRTRLRGVLGAIALGALVLIAVWIGRVPFVVGAHWWRRRYGISRADYSTILLDPWLERLGTLAAACVAIGLFVLLARWLGDRWWIVGGPMFAVVGAVFLLAQPFLFVPRVEPLRDRELAREIRALAQRQGVGEVKVEVRDASRRTRAINAQLYGVGPTKRMILWDTALDGRLSRAEILGLAAHEFGHVQAHHIWKSIGWLFLISVPAAYVVARVTRLAGGLARPAVVPLALLAVVVLQLLLLPATNAVSRRYEAEADWLALRATREPRAYEGLTRTLAEAALADPDPPRWVRIVLDTHPTTLERIAMSRSVAGPRGGS
jgi:STE24 endopeptidase